MLELSDLIQILAVSREWSAAVRSMKPIRASIARDNSEWRSIRERNACRPLPPIASIIVSPLLRHVAAIEIKHNRVWTQLTNAPLALLAQYAPNLQSLWCTLILTPTDPLTLPAQLTSLGLSMDDAYTDAEIDGVLTALAALPSLSRLHFSLAQFGQPSEVELRILAAAPSLRDLTLEDTRQGPAQLSDEQTEQIRASLGHLLRVDVGRNDSEDLAGLLKPPVSARWQDIGFVLADADTGELLLRLSTLTTLTLNYRWDTAQLDFLSQLLRLTTLRLDCVSWAHGGGWTIPPVDALASLVRCTGLTDVHLRCGFSSAQYSTLFAKLTRIKKLTLDSAARIESLQFLVSGPITHTLEELCMYKLFLPPSEVSHLYGLRRLRSLDSDCGFDPPLGDAAVDSLSPPTPLLPALTSSVHQWRIGDGLQNVRRQGPSYEWMQARRTQ